VSARAARGEAPATDDHELRSLRERALAAMSRAYAPYSNFLVGAALLGTDGSIVEGCNVENAAFPSGTCAERVALGTAVTRGVRSFRTVVIATSGDTPAPPCGMCRQALVEFSPELEIISITRTGTEARWRLSELLPHAFTPASLDKIRD
jgi:cytidine deaminase